MNWLKLLWPSIRPKVVVWLETRALRLPALEASRIAKKLGTSVEIVNGVMAAGAAYAEAQIDALVR